MKKLFFSVTTALLIFSCNNSETKTEAGIGDSIKADSAVKAALPLADSTAVPEGVEEGSIILRNGNVVINWGNKMVDLTTKEMMMREIEKNEKGEWIIKVGKMSIPFTEDMKMDKDNNIFMVKDSKTMKWENGKWQESK